MVNKISSTSSFKKLLIVSLLIWVTLRISNSIFEKHIIFEINSQFPAKFKSIMNHEPGDLAVFGPSYTLNGIDPSSFEGRIYNYSLSGAGYVVSSILMKEFFKQDSISPLIISFYPDFLYHPGPGDRKYYLPYIEEQFFNDIKDLNFKLYEKSKALKYFSRYPEFYSEYLRERSSSTENYSRGSVLRLKPGLEAPSAPFNVNSNKGNWLLPDEIESFFELLRTQAHRSFFLVRTPVTPKGNYVDNPMDIANIWKQINSLPNVTFLDYKNMVLPYSYFADHTHLNAEGAKHFSDLLAREISDSRMP